jgi:hypothetical protein
LQVEAHREGPLHEHFAEVGLAVLACKVGFFVGCVVGLLVGCAVGMLVGCAEGCAVGELVAGEKVTGVGRQKPCWNSHPGLVWHVLVLRYRWHGLSG